MREGPLLSRWILPLLLVLASGAALASDEAGVEVLTERLEARMRAAEPVLRREDLGHYALLHEVEEEDLLRATAMVSFRPDGRAFVLGVGDVVEPHGGGILRLLFSQWRPASRVASEADRFFFRPNRQALSLGALYEGHKRQVFLPAAPAPREVGTGAAAAPAASAPHLPRMRFFAAEPGVADVERDAFAFLQLLVAREADYGAAWTNHQGQRVSVDLLLKSAWDHYLLRREAGLEREDHSHLHLVELLLAYRRGVAARGGRAAPLDLEAIRARFLDVELARAGADDEATAHYAESLGLLVAEEGLCWGPAHRQRLGDWLRSVERRFADLDRADPGELTHLLRGLRMLRLHDSRLAGRERCPAAPPEP